MSKDKTFGEILEARRLASLEPTPPESQPPTPAPVEPAHDILTPLESEPASAKPAEPPPTRAVIESRPVDPTRVDTATDDPMPLVPTPLETKPLPSREAISGNFTKLPTDLIAGDLAALSTGAQVVYLHLIALTVNHNTDTCIVGKSRLIERTGMSDSSVVRATRQLAAFGLVEIVRVDGSAPKLGDRGTEYRVYLPRATRYERAPVETRRVEPARVASGAIKETKSKEGLEKPTVFDLRIPAAIILESNRRTPGYTLAHLRRDLRLTQIAEGREVAQELIEEATRGMLPET